MEVPTSKERGSKRRKTSYRSQKAMHQNVGLLIPKEKVSHEVS